ncbi:MAG: putative toxin-antitoxin system toxin component, PIN family [Solirubrobacterales bacterium]
MTPRVVLDTNVIVSGLGWRGVPAAILDAVSDDRLVLVTSAPLLAELRRVLEYPKLAKVIKGGAQIADLVAASGVVVAPGRVLTVVSDDDDNRVLEAAIEGAADYIVSGDADLLDIGSFEGIPIITPGEFAATALGGGSGDL